MILTDAQWQLIQPLIAPHLPVKSNPNLGGRPPINERLVLDGILYKLTTNLPWYDLPPSYPSYQTCYRRYRQWQRLGVLNAILAALYQDCLERGGVDPLNALEQGLVSLTHENGEWRCCIAPHLHHTWQLSVILLFLGVALRRMRSYRTFKFE
jgi:transposase